MVSLSWLRERDEAELGCRGEVSGQQGQDSPGQKRKPQPWGIWNGLQPMKKCLSVVSFTPPRGAGAAPRPCSGHAGQGDAGNYKAAPVLLHQRDWPNRGVLAS